jgi:hypothetical protein
MADILTEEFCISKNLLIIWLKRMDWLASETTDKVQNNIVAYILPAPAGPVTNILVCPPIPKKAVLVLDEFSCSLIVQIVVCFIVKGQHICRC